MGMDNALKRSPKDMLKNERENILKKNVGDFLRPQKSYCLKKQWPSMSATKQNSFLQPVFEAFLLIQDTSHKSHKYSNVNSLEDVRFLVKN